MSNQEHPMSDEQAISKVMDEFCHDAYYATQTQIVCQIYVRKTYPYDIVDTYRGTVGEVTEWLRITWPGVRSVCPPTPSK